jgi:hypothetical protein
MAKPRCQCDPSCKNQPLPRKPFCKEHLDCTRKSRPSKYTTPYEPWRYNKYPGVQESLNCYAYAFDYRRLPKTCTKQSCPVSYPQPGRASGYPTWSKVKGKRCPDVVARIMGDVHGSKLTTFEKTCKGKTRKIAVVADPDQDYHFYRQDADGYWSHKPGATKVTRLDTTKRPIYDPALASRDNKSSNLNYDKFCGYMCIPTKKARLRRD